MHACMHAAGCKLQLHSNAPPTAPLQARGLARTYSRTPPKFARACTPMHVYIGMGRMHAMIAVARMHEYVAIAYMHAYTATAHMHA